jgi:beta-glucosidase
MKPLRNGCSRRTFISGSLLIALQSYCRRAIAWAFFPSKPEEILQDLSLGEKIALCHGAVQAIGAPALTDSQTFEMGGVPRLGISPISMRDGREAIRPIPSDRVEYTTTLPCTLSLACTWDTDAAIAFGGLLAEELLAMRVNVMFGPCINLGRTPLDGRIFENLGEDPFLAGTMASAYIQGSQQLGVAACSSLLAANDCETFRHYTSSNMDERTLREMHLLPYEISVTDGHVWTMMAANSLLNGIHDAENHHLIQAIVKDELGFDGVVLTDWRAAYETVATALAGTDMTCGFCAYVFGDGGLLAAVKAGKVPESLIDDKARRILRLYERSGVLDPAKRAKGGADTQAHRVFARKVAAEGMVLLKNDGHLLPVDSASTGTILVTGPAADAVPAGIGSGGIGRPPFEISPLQGLKSAFGGHVKLASKDSLYEEAKSAEIVLFFAQDKSHGEGDDLNDLELPGQQAQTISELAAVNAKIAVILLTGGAISLEPWADKVPAILEAWYAGQSTGDAIADVLTGKVNPSGKLARTFGKHLNDYACHALGLWPPRLLLDKPPSPPSFRREDRRDICAYAADYTEGVFMGYRWFDEKKIAPRFPFGHGLSYTRFSYSDLEVKEIGPAIHVQCTVRNEGEREGAEVVQVYIAPPPSSVPRPLRELKGFAKVRLRSGESKRAAIVLRPSALAFYDESTKKWKAEPGKYDVLVGISSRDIRLSTSIWIETTLKFSRF